MKIEHLAIWVKDLEVMKAFYEKYFEGKAGKKYTNEKKQFTSYFLTFSEGSRIELMHKPQVAALIQDPTIEHLGLAHFAISVGSKDKVDQLTQKLSSDAYTILGHPRTTGDGYYESLILDPENNRIEITI